VTETGSDLVRLGRRPADHDTERQNPHPDGLSAGELHAQGKIIRSTLFVLSNSHFMFKNRDIPHYLKLFFIAYT
nr:hypothetical protein [Escherichia coli]